MTKTKGWVVKPKELAVGRGPYRIVWADFAAAKVLTLPKNMNLPRTDHVYTTKEAADCRAVQLTLSYPEITWVVKRILLTAE